MGCTCSNTEWHTVIMMYKQHFTDYTRIGKIEINLRTFDVIEYVPSETTYPIVDEFIIMLMTKLQREHIALILNTDDKIVFNIEKDTIAGTITRYKDDKVILITIDRHIPDQIKYSMFISQLTIFRTVETLMLK